ncbi:MAG TPA: hypothetical protein EYP35_02365 [Desulfobacterales bacterium]|nr:hypothetical protein [Desulfobacterales bacterium]
MFEFNFPGELFKKNAFRWLKLITVLCFVSAILLVFIHNKTFFLFSLLLPFANSFVINLIFIFIIVSNLNKFGTGEISLFIKDNFPEIWRKLHPLGRLSYNIFSYWAFINGKYDDGNDEKLNHIKKDEKSKIYFILWTNLLVPIIWISNLIIFKFASGS